MVLLSNEEWLKVLRDCVRMGTPHLPEMMVISSNNKMHAYL